MQKQAEKLSFMEKETKKQEIEALKNSKLDKKNKSRYQDNVKRGSTLE